MARRAAVVRLGVLARAVIAASGIWLVAGTLLFATLQFREVSERASATYKQCIDASSNWAGCSKASDEVIALGDKYVWTTATGVAVVCLVLGLILFTILYWLVRWILAGRDTKKLSEKRID